MSQAIELFTKRIKDQDAALADSAVSTPSCGSDRLGIVLVNRLADLIGTAVDRGIKTTLCLAVLLIIMGGIAVAILAGMPWA